MSSRVVRVMVAVGVFLLSASAAAARPRFGVAGGPQFTELVARANEFESSQVVHWTATGFGGAAVELPLRGGLVIMTGIEYGQHSDEQLFVPAISLIGPTSLGESRRELRQRVFASPVRLEWRPGPWRLGAGPELRYLLRAEQRWRAPQVMPMATGSAAARGRVAGPAAQIFESVRPGVWYDATSVFRRWSLAAQLAVGREVPLGTHALRADLRWSEGITHQQWAATAAQRSRAAQLALAWLW